MCLRMLSVIITSAFLGCGCRPSCAAEDEESCQGRAWLWTRSGQDGAWGGRGSNGRSRGVLATGWVDCSRESVLRVLIVGWGDVQWALVLEQSCAPGSEFIPAVPLRSLETTHVPQTSSATSQPTSLPKSCSQPTTSWRERSSWPTPSAPSRPSPRSC